MREITQIKDFLLQYGDILKENIIKKLKPIYNPQSKDKWDEANSCKLDSLKRKPLSSQRDAILSLSKAFYKENKKSLFLVAEMGTGKTFMSISVAHLMPKSNKRVLVVCPPHLADKWVREIDETIPHARVKKIENISDIDLSSPQGFEFWVMKNTTAKLHYSLKPISSRKCPDCGIAIDDFEGKKNTKDEVPEICPKCRTSLYYADRDRFRRYGLAEYIKRKKVRIDFLILDEVHELKGGDTAVGQVMANLVSYSEKTLALTGTLMGGYASNLFYLLFRMFTGYFIKNGFSHNSVTEFSRRYGMYDRIIKYRERDESKTSISSIKKVKYERITGKPGVSPELLPEFLLENAYFMKLSDVTKELPKYTEEVILVDMCEPQESAYKKFESDLRNEVRNYLQKGSKRLLGALVNSLYAAPDGIRKGDVVLDPITDRLIASLEAIDIPLLPKEEQLIDLVIEEKSRGRRCAVFLEHTGTRDLIPDLVERMENAGLKVLILRSGSPEADKRENWIRTKLEKDKDIDVLICNPNLVKTGLDLLDFPTIIFFQTGYNVFTIRQAARRSWRIGQKLPVKVYFMAYAGTMQEVAIKLVATKMETALAVEGDLSDTGLTELSSGDSIAIEMAKVLVNNEKVDKTETLKAFQSYREQESMSILDIDEKFVEQDSTNEDILITNKGNKVEIKEHKVLAIIQSIAPKKVLDVTRRKKGASEIDKSLTFISVFDILTELERQEMLEKK